MPLAGPTASGRSPSSASAPRTRPSPTSSDWTTTVRRRVRHVVTEIERVDASWPRRPTFLAAVGDPFVASHASMRDDYEISCEELDLVVETAWDTAPSGRG